MSDLPPGVIAVSGLGHSHPVLDLCEGLLDRIEVGGVGWQEPEARAGGGYGLSNRLALVAAEIVHDDDVAWLEGRDEQRVDIGPEPGAVDRAVDDEGRGDPVAAQGGEEGHGAPVTVGGETAKALALHAPAAQRRHVGLDPGLIPRVRLRRPEDRL